MEFNIVRDLGRMEGDLQNVKSDVSEMKSDIKEIKATINRAQGSIKTLWVIASLAGAAGAIVSRFFFLWIGLIK